jgi:hypothetical protein
VPHFVLVTRDGESLGPVELGRPDWPIGSIIYTGRDEPNLRVIDRLDNDDDPEAFACLVVEPAD